MKEITFDSIAGDLFTFEANEDYIISYTPDDKNVDIFINGNILRLYSDCIFISKGDIISIYIKEKNKYILYLKSVEAIKNEIKERDNKKSETNKANKKLGDFFAKDILKCMEWSMECYNEMENKFPRSSNSYYIKEAYNFLKENLDLENDDKE